MVWLHGKTTVRLQEGYNLDITLPSPTNETCLFQVTNHRGEVFTLSQNQVFSLQKYNSSQHYQYTLQWEGDHPLALIIKPYVGLLGGNGLSANSNYHAFNKYLLPRENAFSELPFHIRQKLLNRLPVDPDPLRLNPTTIQLSIEIPSPIRTEKQLPFQSSQSNVFPTLLKHTWSFRTYMHESLYGIQGYYSAGKVKWEVEDIKGDFTTCAIESPHLAQQIANQIFMMWKTMVETGAINPEKPFTILEMGAGNGLFAFNLLTHLIQHFETSSNHEMNQFAKVVNYKIVEISPSLVKDQKLLNSAFIESKKLQIYLGSAYELPKLFKNGELSGVAISNELIDSAPVHQVRLNEKREVEVLVVLPYTQNIEDLTESATLLRRFRRRSEYLKENFVDELGLKAIEDADVKQDETSEVKTTTFLSTKDLRLLPPDKLKELLWLHCYVNASLFPDVQEFITDYGVDYFKNIDVGNKAYINTTNSAFMGGISEVFSDNCFVITMDYGKSHANFPDRNIPLAQLRRGNFSLCDSPLIVRPNEMRNTPLANPDKENNHHSYFGILDLSVYVNFSLLTDAGLKYGLQPIVFMPQVKLEDVMMHPNELEIVKTPECQKGSFFNVLIQQKKSTKALFFIPGENNPVSFLQLHRDESTNKKLANIENRSRFLAAVFNDFIQQRNSKSEVYEDLKNYYQEFINYYYSKINPLHEEQPIQNEFEILLWVTPDTEDSIIKNEFYLLLQLAPFSEKPKKLLELTKNFSLVDKKLFKKTLAYYKDLKFRNEPKGKSKGKEKETEKRVMTIELQRD
jgi:SAM-dependent MidA family methyltransferase